MLNEKYTFIGARYRDIIRIYTSINDVSKIPIIDLIHNNDMQFYESLMIDFNNSAAEYDSKCCKVRDGEAVDGGVDGSVDGGVDVEAVDNTIDSSINETPTTALKPPSICIRSSNKFYSKMLPDTVLTYNETYICTENHPDHLFQNGDVVIFKGFVTDTYPSTEDMLKVSPNASKIMKNRVENDKITNTSTCYKYSLKFLNTFDDTYVFIPLCFNAPRSQERTSSTDNSYIVRNGHAFKACAVRE
jgi:hypothetical protein